jgi:hypothetical protein
VDVEEELPPKVPKPGGKKVSVGCFVDANRAGNVVARCSHTGVLIFTNRAPVWWFSKKQSAVEPSAFGSEFVALRIVMEQIKALRHKLRMLGVPVNGPADALCGDQGVVKNASTPEPTLSKKHNSTNCSLVREPAAAGAARVGKEGTETNLADGLTKSHSAPKRHKIFGSTLHR